MPHATTQPAPPAIDLDRVHADLSAVAGSPSDRALAVVRWAVRSFGDRLIMTSSFGAESAVMLHLVTRVVPDIPVVFIDTGYLFPETYRFAEQLRDRLKLNLKVYQAVISPAWMEATRGRLWEEGLEGMNRYDRLRKVEPMQRALRELDPLAWLAGLRRGQTDHRSALRYVEEQGPHHKIHPVLTWTGRDSLDYLKAHDLPYHPLFDQGYKSIGDVHSTAPVGADDHERSGRFRGLKQECGLHLPTTPEEGQSRDASGL